MNKKHVILLALIFLTLLIPALVACDDWDGMDRGDEFNGVLTRQIQAGPQGTPHE